MFRKALHIAFLSIAFLLIQAHTLLPHEHGSEGEQTEWLGLLSGLTDIDLGASHLEDYKPEKETTSFEIKFGFSSTLNEENDFSIQIEVYSNQVYLTEAPARKQAFFYNNHFFRGPPALI